MVHNNPKIAPILKLRYLKICLIGDAAEVIASVQLSGENYLVAWKGLKETYDNRKLIKQNYMQDLLNIPCMSKKFSIRALINHVQKHIRALRDLNEPVDQWGRILIILIKNKINFITAEKWDEFSCEIDCPGLDEIISFLQKRAQLDDTKSAQTRNKINVPQYKKSQLNSRLNNRSQQKMFLAATTSTLCPLCKSQNELSLCSSFLDLSPSERFKIIKGENLCVNCFQASHRTNKCTEKNCEKCQKKHNILLHFENKVDKENNSYTSPAKTSTNYLTRNDCVSDILLSATVDIVNEENNVKQCRLLLDSGSQTLHSQSQ